MSEGRLYDDGKIACDETGLLIRWYYLWGSKRIPYSEIKGFQRLPINIRRWRLWGSGDFRHWWNLDLHRPKSSVALVLDTGGWIRPTITPRDLEAVEAVLREHRVPGAP